MAAFPLISEYGTDPGEDLHKVRMEGSLVDYHGHGDVEEGIYGEASDDEVNYGNRYATWTPRLLRAAYNYQYVAKDPGAYAHNPTYILQVLYDTPADIGSTARMTRP